MPTMDDAVRLIRQIDEQVDAIEAEAKSKVAALKAQRSTLEAWINKKSLEEGIDSFRTPHGTAFFTTTAYCSVADWDKVWEYMVKNDKFELLTHAVAKKAVTELVQATGEVPPGLTYGQKRTLNIRKPSATA